MQKYGKWLKLVGIILWLYIILQLDFGKVVKVFSAIDFRWFLAATACLVGTYCFKALRWRTVLTLQRVHYGIFKTIGITFLSSFFGLVIPGKLGDVIKLTYTKSSGLPFARGLVSIVLDRIYDLAVLLSLSLFGLFYFSGVFISEVWEISLILGVLALMTLLVLTQRMRLFKMMKKFLRLVLSSSSYATLSEGWEAFRMDFGKVLGKTFLPMLGLSVLAYFCMFCQFYALARGIGLNPPFSYLGLSLAVATLVSLLPISVGGLGTREAVFIIMLNKISITSESAVLLSFIDLALFAVLIPALFSLPFWLRREE
ncbi:MAG: lysylphosphatidylglycerol synthase transmembrane domain-containing protein [Ignavibacteriales bacterium]|nr:lysylphosphatidylglycerol synthase transmembrane domain-containing protein [Ignavibacteriales bacterium]